jgi:hypothetical protein
MASKTDPSGCPSTDPGDLTEDFLASILEAPGENGKNMKNMVLKSTQMLEFLTASNEARKKWGEENNNPLVVKTAEERLAYLKTCDEKLEDALDSPCSHHHLITICMNIH